MIEAFYYRIYKYLHMKYLSLLLAYALRGCFLVRFLVKKITLKDEYVSMGEEEAYDILKRTSPDPNQKPDYKMMQCDPSIDLSIIVPVYNNCDVVEKCINSLIKQKTKYCYELILVDDGSTDGAEDLIENYRNNKNVIIIHQNNRGIAAARNTGISHAGGKYFMFVDCDDTVEDSIVEELLSKAEKGDCDIVMCGHSRIKMSGETVKDTIPNIHPQINLLGYKNNDEIMNYAGLPWAKVFKRKLFEKVRFFPGYWYEDAIVHMLLFPQCNRFNYVPKSLYNYLWHERNFSHVQEGKRAKNKTVDHFWIIKAIVKHYNEIGLPQGAMLYTQILEHFSTYCYRSISSMPDDVVQAIFVAGRGLLLQNKPDQKVRLPYILRLIEKALIEKNIALWKLCSVYQ